MLEFVFRKAIEIGKVSGSTPGPPVRALTVNALDHQAATFYTRHGFEPSPTDPLHMFMLIKDIAKAIGDN